ncbi:MAG: hypothetical protein M3552_18460 [Planctomycetota bacterium]|nr:hypothetical protein [Planctomycetaceae bacterium]MDQ3332601.1 hypothetical protein [Planctomycetota bacterium]
MIRRESRPAQTMEGPPRSGGGKVVVEIERPEWDCVAASAASPRLARFGFGGVG